MRMFAWIREALEGYRWLWKAQLRWRRGPVWLAAFEFVVRIVDDLAAGVLTALEADWTRPAAASAGITPEGRTTMAVPHLRPAFAGVHSANERLKAGFDSWMWTSMIVAALIHFATFAFWPEMTAADTGIESKEIIGVIIPPEIVLPDRPEPLDAPARPVMSPIELDEDVTIGKTDFDSNPIDELPPPPQSITTEISRAEAFTPFTVQPRVLNTDEVVRAMRREYPSVLRDSGIGGTVGILFHIDSDGKVLAANIDSGSGYASLDEAALAVANVIRFSPAMNRDDRVAVRVVFPIVFRVLD